MTFAQWLSTQTLRDTDVGALARHWAWPLEWTTRGHFTAVLAQEDAPPTMHEALDVAWIEFLNVSRRSASRVNDLECQHGRQRRKIQIRALYNDTATVQCFGTHPTQDGCGKVVLGRHAYQCFYCGQWFCESCAGKHFGESRRRRENRASQAKSVGNSHWTGPSLSLKKPR